MVASRNLLRHVVLFRLKDGTTPEQAQSVGNAFMAMREKIEAIHDLEWGADVSVEGKTEGYTHCLLVTFTSEAGRDAYLPHPDHRAASAAARPFLEKVLVLDFWSQT